MVLLVILRSVFLMVTVKVVWVLGPPTFLPRNLIVGLMVENLFHIGLVIIHPLVIPTKISLIIKYPGYGMINLVLLVVVGVVLVFRQPTYPPINMV